MRTRSAPAYCRWPRRGSRNAMRDHEIAQIRDLWIQNVPTKDICNTLCVASRTVRKYVRDLPPRTINRPIRHDVLLMRSLRRMGACVDDIAGAMGCSERTVLNYVRDIPCPWGRWKLARWTSVDPLVIVDLLASGLDAGSIAERFGVSKRTVWVQGAAATRNPKPYRIRRECQQIVKRELIRLAKARSSEVCDGKDMDCGTRLSYSASHGA